MDDSSRRRNAAILLGFGIAALSTADAADVAERLSITAISGVATDDSAFAINRLELRPEVDVYWGERWKLALAGRLELASDDTGLGTRDTYSSASEPLVARDDVRLELDRVTLAYQHGGLTATLGKQVVAWGVLDGIRVTDRFDAVRRREFVFTETRPERISRWGARLTWRRKDWSIDVAGALDPSVNQLAEPGTVFDPVAPRLRGGVAPGNDPLVTVAARNRYFHDATYGARVGKRIGSANVTVLALSGPDTDPVFAAATLANAPAVALTYPRRQLFGASLDAAIGDVVLRLEAAYIPDQLVNTLGAAPLASTERARTLAGIGLDWNAPAGWFVNLQWARDHIESGPATLVRPQNDDIATVRLQRGFVNDTWRAKIEWIGSTSDGDGAFRPSIEYRPTDALALTLGWDRIRGARDELFGQFADASRVWLRATVTF